MKYFQRMNREISQIFQCEEEHYGYFCEIEEEEHDKPPCTNNYSLKIEEKPKTIIYDAKSLKKILDKLAKAKTNKWNCYIQVCK